MVNIYHQSQCPVHGKIGNAINFVRLFKEQADSDWNYQNLQTEFKLRLHQISPKKGDGATHRIVFEVQEEKSPKRAWLYCIEARYDEAEILMEIQKFARFRLYTNDKDSDFAERMNQLVVDNFFHYKPRLMNSDQDKDYAEHYIYKLHNKNSTKCNPLSKMEYDYFYYLYSNYYKLGAPKAWGLVEPVPPFSN
jgi:hypothetical protein